jgi:hypothetical protein
MRFTIHGSIGVPPITCSRRIRSIRSALTPP